MKLKTLAPIAIAACVAIVLALIVTLAYNNTREAVGWAREKQLSALAGMIELFLRERTGRTTASAELLASLPLVGDLTARNDHDGLARLLLPGFRKASTKYGVEAATVITPPATALLRLHDPAKFGDDLAASRPILVFANQTRDVQTGLEIGAAVGIRGVAPIYAGTRHVGALEWATGLAPVLAEIKAVTGAETVALIREAAIPADSPIHHAENRRLKDFLAVEATDWPFLASVLVEGDVARVNEGAIVTRTVNGTDLGVVKVPLFEFSGKNVGAILAVKEIGEFRRTVKDTLVRLSIAGALGLLAVTCVTLLIVSGLLLRPLDRLSKRLNGLAGGDFSTKVYGVGRGDEIGTLAASTESLRLDLLRRYPPGSAPALDTEMTP